MCNMQQTNFNVTTSGKADEERIVTEGCFFFYRGVYSITETFRTLSCFVVDHVCTTVIAPSHAVSIVSAAAGLTVRDLLCMWIGSVVNLSHMEASSRWTVSVPTYVTIFSCLNLKVGRCKKCPYDYGWEPHVVVGGSAA